MYVAGSRPAILDGTERRHSRRSVFARLEGRPPSPIPREKDRYARLPSRHQDDVARDQPAHRAQPGARPSTRIARRPGAAHGHRARRGHVHRAAADRRRNHLRRRHRPHRARPPPHHALRPNAGPVRRRGRHSLQPHHHHAERLRRLRARARFIRHGVRAGGPRCGAGRAHSSARPCERNCRPLRRWRR